MTREVPARSNECVKWTRGGACFQALCYVEVRSGSPAVVTPRATYAQR
jgi:hypothetical protein